MSTIIVFFSLFGHNREVAKNYSKDINCEAIEFDPGSRWRVFQYLSGKRNLMEKANKLSDQIKDCDEIIIFGPIWGGKPAPAVIVLLKSLKMAGKRLKCYFSYTMNYGQSEFIIKELVSKRDGILTEIKFNKI